MIYFQNNLLGRIAVLLCGLLLLTE